ncbi:MAG: Cdc6/Cdc18 family protein [Candidatus Pacearchaeota archaeon]
MDSEIENIFDSFDNNAIFKNKSVLQSNHYPDDILHRKDQIKQVASILAPILRNERASNLFLYGKTGTGKTISIKYVKDQLTKRIEKESNFDLQIEYLNCKLKKVSDTEYRILAELVKKLGGSVPDTGLPTQAVYSKFLDLIDSKQQLIVLILDEIDQTVKKISNDFLYNLTRVNSELSQSQICIVGISNDLTFLEQIDPRVRSSLSEEEIVFPPYSALQLKDILNKRVENAFKEDVIEEGVVAKCAAFAAREHGDARRALDLLRVSGELAERDGSGKITLDYVDKANDKIENDKILDVISSESKQFELVLYSIIQLSKKKNSEPFFTGDVFNHYQKICNEIKSQPLTQRRVSDMIQEMDMFGIINVNVISKGRGGRMREINLAVSDQIVNKAENQISSNIYHS